MFNTTVASFTSNRQDNTGLTCEIQHSRQRPVGVGQTNHSGSKTLQLRAAHDGNLARNAELAWRTSCGSAASARSSLRQALCKLGDDHRFAHRVFCNLCRHPRVLRIQAILRAVALPKRRICTPHPPLLDCCLEKKGHHGMPLALQAMSGLCERSRCLIYCLQGSLPAWETHWQKWRLCKLLDKKNKRGGMRIQLTRKQHTPCRGQDAAD